MARKNNLTKSKSLYTIKKRHSFVNDGIIYENDLVTIVPNTIDYDDEVTLFADSNFKYLIRQNENGKKRHVRGEFVKQSGGDSDIWTLENIEGGNISDESRIVLKPNSNSLKDFAYYGSATELIKATINDVILRFPGGLYYLGNKAKKVKYENKEYYTISNEFNIDCWTKVYGASSGSVKNPMRILSLSYLNYIDGNGSDIDEPIININSECRGGIVGTVEINGDTFHIFLDRDGKKHLLTEDKSKEGVIIKPKQEFIDKWWDSVDDFEKVLLNRNSTPSYRAIFETPYLTEDGVYYEMASYTWPTVCNDGFTPELTTNRFQHYLDSLLSLAEYHDEYDSDNLWRMMTHESIKNLDWTYSSNQTDIEGGDFDSKGLSAMLRIYGRQFDDLKRWADNVKASNNITYNGKNNTPDYFLSDITENKGWDSTNIAPFGYETVKLMSGSTAHANCSYVNSQFLRTLALNSDYLLSMKGTRRGIEAIMKMFGYTYGEQSAGTFSINEYVYGVESALSYTTASYYRGAFEYLYDDENINLMNGYPVAPITPYGEEDEDTSLWYLVPWFDKKQHGNKNFYFQSAGGWGKKPHKFINLPSLTDKCEFSGTTHYLYEETYPYMKFASNIDDLLSMERYTLNENVVCYVDDISDLNQRYSKSIADADKSDYSHYFILKNVALSNFCGFISNDLYNCYGWRNVLMSEIKNVEGDGEVVVYMETLKSEERGNNPHVGYGKYDDGESYLKRFQNLFGNALEEGLLDHLENSDEITDREIYNDISNGYGFNMFEIVDNKKCAFFKDYHNDIISELYPLSNDNEDITWNSRLEYFEFNPENIELDDSLPLDESQANGIVNVKKLVINFNTEGNKYLQKYFQNIVVKYIETMVPSTTILEYRFDGNHYFISDETPSVYNNLTHIEAAQIAVNKDDNFVAFREDDNPIILKNI